MEDSTFSNDSRRGQQQQMSLNNFGPSPTNRRRSVSPANRRSSTTAFETCRSFSRDSSPQPVNRRFSNPINQTNTTTTYASRSASVSRARSPSDSQYIGAGVTVAARRFSQPTGSVYGGSYGENEDDDPIEPKSLACQEKESYSSLTYLPEVRAYLKFMEDDIPMPHRSKSFNGRNSSRRSSYNRRKRSKSRTRTPTPTPMDYDDDDCFQKQFLFERAEAKSYGRYLTPQRSLEPNANTNSNNRSNSIDFTDTNCARYSRQHSREDDQPPSACSSEMLPRRRSSLIKTTFI